MLAGVPGARLAGAAAAPSFQATSDIAWQRKLRAPPPFPATTVAAVARWKSASAPRQRPPWEPLPLLDTLPEPPPQRPSRAPPLPLAQARPAVGMKALRQQLESVAAEVAAKAKGSKEMSAANAALATRLAKVRVNVEANTVAGGRAVRNLASELASLQHAFHELKSQLDAKDEERRRFAAAVEGRRVAAVAVAAAEEEAAAAQAEVALLKSENEALEARGREATEAQARLLRTADGSTAGSNRFSCFFFCACDLIPCYSSHNRFPCYPRQRPLPWLRLRTANGELWSSGSTDRGG